jgi:RHS repeat-associated protein
MALAAAQEVRAVEDDYEFMPLHGGRIIAETGGDDATTVLMEGFPGLDAEPGKNRWLEPVDGSGGFDNVAPQLSVEEGPGGLEWDPSPTYRTRYKNGTNYATSTTNPQGNNWFTKIPYFQYDSTNDKYVVRFDANTFRVYDLDSGTTYKGRYANGKSVFKSGFVRLLYDIGGKTYTFDLTSRRCTLIEGVGDAEIAITYTGTTSITVVQKSNSSTEVRKFTYTLEASGTRIDKIEVAEKQGGSWVTYRTIDFTYHDNVTGATGSSSGDLIGIEDQKNLTESGKSYKRNWVFKYYTGTYNQSTNPGYPYQVEAVIEPGSVRKYLDDNPTKTVTDLYKTATSSLSSYLDRKYKYESDRRLDELTLYSGCGCGGAAGTHTYNWDVNGSTPSDLNTWYRRVNITLPNGAKRMVDYNKYGEVLNSILQEVAGNPSSRRWIRTFSHDTTGRLTDGYSVEACSSYDDSTHVVTTNTTAGMRYQYAYDTNSALSTVKLRKVSNGDWLFQRKMVFSFTTSGDRRRYFKTSDTVYPTETTTDSGGNTTSFSYTYHASDALAVKKRTTTLPKISTAENGPGDGAMDPAVVVFDYLETDILNTWHTDGEGHVHYTGFDTGRRTATLRVIDVDTDAADRPPGVPAPPDSDFSSSTGLNIITSMTYDELRRMTKLEHPAFNAWNGSTVASTKTTERWHFSKLSGDQLVVLHYPHVDSAYHHAAVSIAVSDHDGDVVTQALGELNSLKRDTNLDDDFDETDSTVEAGFEGTIVERTDLTYDGSKLTKTEVWSDADNGSAAKHTTLNTYDASGLLETTKTPALTITRYTYDVLHRRKSTKVGTTDGGPSDNMTLVEELWYDDEEDTSTNVGDGYLTRRRLHTSYLGGGERTTDYSYDYRGRLIEIIEPLQVAEERDYDNLGRVTEVRRYDDSTATLMAKSAHYFDDWGQEYETRTYGIVSGSGTDYTKVETWRDGRGLTIKTLSQGKVFSKTQYDGAGRVTNRAVSYDSAELDTEYAEAFDLLGDTVVDETRYTLDGLGRAELVRHYERRHDGTGTGGLTVGSGGNGRAQYAATWYDEFGRGSRAVSYGTNGGTDLSSRPTGNPPSASDADKLVTKYTYTIKSQVEDVTDPRGIVRRTTYTDWGALSKEIDNYVDGTPGTDDDRTVEMTYKSTGQLEKCIAKASGVDQQTEYVYGVTRGTGDSNSKITSNELLQYIKYPDPATGNPGGVADQEKFSYNAHGEVTYKVSYEDNIFVYVYDDRGRLLHDRAIGTGTGVDTTVLRISRTYDALDRPVKVTSYDNATVGLGSVVNEVQYEYDKFAVVKTIYQEWAGAVNVSTSKKVTFAYQFPTDGTTGLRRTSTTYPDSSSTVVTEVYNSGMDDTLSRLSGRKKGTDWLFQESYLGLGRLVERSFGATGRVWTLIGTDTPNQDNYVGLDRFARIDDLVLKNGGTNLNRYLYSYNYNSQITVREDKVGNVYGFEVFDETFAYDNLGRLTNHKRGAWDGSSMSSIQLHECWTLDRSGNADDYYNGTASTCGSTRDLAFNASNEITTSPYTYHKAGELKDKPNTESMVFDAWNRLVEYKSGTEKLAVYRYNGLNQKVKRTDSDNLADTYYYYNDAWQLVVENKVSDGSLIFWYVWGTQYIDDVAVRSNGSTSSYFQYQVSDAGFNVTTRLNYDGTVAARHTYEAYGDPLQWSADWLSQQTITQDLYLFQGRQRHKDHAQYDYRNRFQDSDLGVFVQRDPIGIWGDEANFGNGYTYVGNDPPNRLDPVGLCASAPQAPTGDPCEFCGGFPGFRVLCVPFCFEYCSCIDELRDRITWITRRAFLFSMAERLGVPNHREWVNKRQPGTPAAGTTPGQVPGNQNWDAGNGATSNMPRFPTDPCEQLKWIGLWHHESAHHHWNSVNGLPFGRVPASQLGITESYAYRAEARLLKLFIAKLEECCLVDPVWPLDPPDGGVVVAVLDAGLAERGWSARGFATVLVGDVSE